MMQNRRRAYNRFSTEPDGEARRQLEEQVTVCTAKCVLVCKESCAGFQPAHHLYVLRRGVLLVIALPCSWFALHRAQTVHGTLHVDRGSRAIAV